MGAGTWGKMDEATLADVGAGAMQHRLITSYTNASDVAPFRTFATKKNDTSVILGRDGARLHHDRRRDPEVGLQQQRL